MGPLIFFDAMGPIIYFRRYEYEPFTLQQQKFVQDVKIK